MKQGQLSREQKNGFLPTPLLPEDLRAVALT